MLPFRFGNPGQFSVVRDFLAHVEYRERTLCKRLGLASVKEYLSYSEKSPSPAPAEASDSLGAVMQVFLVGSSVSRDLIGGFIPDGVWEAMEALGIVCADTANAGQYYSPVVLYPVQDLYIASDRWRNPDGSPIPTVKDYVFPAIHPLTLDFLELLPQSPCERLLELCSGTAVAALLAAKRYAGQAWAIDITERSTHFAEFNRRLNAVDRAIVMQGDLYKPVRDTRFERIVAHPPYVPSLEPGAIYADGGQDGEFITRAIVQGLPQFLERHGRLYCATMGVEREGEPLERRVRQWLAAANEDFDIVFITERTQGPAQFAYRAARNKRSDFKRMDEWIAHMVRLRIKNLAHGLLVMQTKESGRSAFTVRRQKGERTAAAEVEWLLNWESAWAGRSSPSLVLDSLPVASGAFELHTVHARQNGHLAPSKFTLCAAHPFVVEYECPPWVATFVARCEGKSTAREHFEAGMRDGWIPPDVSGDKFAGTLGTLISSGFLEIADFPLPMQSIRH